MCVEKALGEFNADLCFKKIILATVERMEYRGSIEWKKDGIPFRRLLHMSRLGSMVLGPE